MAPYFNRVIASVLRSVKSAKNAGISCLPVSEQQYHERRGNGQLRIKLFQFGTFTSSKGLFCLHRKAINFRPASVCLWWKCKTFDTKCLELILVQLYKTCFDLILIGESHMGAWDLTFDKNVWTTSDSLSI